MVQHMIADNTGLEIFKILDIILIKNLRNLKLYDVKALNSNLD